jgi:aminoglycoside phosphotransferase
MIEKTYEGPRRSENARRERACLLHLRGRLPVPEVLDSDAAVPRVVLRAVSGRHGQECIDEGHAPLVLRLVGAALRELHTIPTATVPELEGDGTVLVHGDFGPQNMLFAVETEAVTAILDWESAHIGDPVEDLAWAEWITRMHHPHAVAALGELFVGVGACPPWHSRHSAMVRRCREILAACEAAGEGATAALWRQRLVETEQWSE